MADTVSKEVRSRMMAGIRSMNTKPEMIIRHGLFAMGFRYRLHGQGLPGRPDLVLPKYRTVIFINGCFWHGHDCSLFKAPSSNSDFWKRKIARNQANDERNRALLLLAGWSVIDVWECTMKGKNRLEVPVLIGEVAEVIRNKTEISVFDIPHSRRVILDN